MSNLFFAKGAALDELYVTMRDGAHPFEAEGRKYVEELWASYGHLVDSDAAQQARNDYAPRFWELYLAMALEENGIELALRAPSGSSTGPDFRTSAAGVWIEAVLATPGTGPDSVVDDHTTGFREVDDAPVLLRLRQALERKRAQRDRWVRSGIVCDDDPFVVAIGTRRSTGRLESPLPRVVSAVFPFGNLQVHIERDTGRLIGESYVYRGHIPKRSGAEVRTDAFLDPRYAGISAVLYASVDELNHPREPGPEFTLVHNDEAANPIPKGFFAFGREYWKDGEDLQSTVHSSEQ